MQGSGKKIVEFTDLYFSEYHKQAARQNLKFPDAEMAFVFYLLDKLVENFAAIGELMKLSETANRKYLRNPSYILLRNALSDIIIISWLLEEPGGKLTLSEKVKDLRRDHIKYHLSYLRKMENLGLLAKEDKLYELNVINTIYSHLLEQEISAILNFKNISKSTSITDMLTNHNKRNPALVAAYQSYFIFSKVEHPGEFTRMILESTYKQEDNPMDQYVESALFTIESNIKVLLPYFFKDEEFVKTMNEFNVVKSA